MAASSRKERHDALPTSSFQHLLSEQLFPSSFAVPKPGHFKPGLQFWHGGAVCAVLRPFALFALFCALWCAFVLFCALLRHLCCFTLLRLRSFALLCVFLCPTAFRTTAFGNFRPLAFETIIFESHAGLLSVAGVQSINDNGGPCYESQSFCALS